MNARRAEGRPAQLRYRRWDGTGTITVQLQRKRGVTAEERAEVAALRASGLTPAVLPLLVMPGAEPPGPHR
jgi:hypothetical protein